MLRTISLLILVVALLPMAGFAADVCAEQTHPVSIDGFSHDRQIVDFQTPNSDKDHSTSDDCNNHPCHFGSCTHVLVPTSHIVFNAQSGFHNSTLVFSYVSTYPSSLKRPPIA
jgi:hypothetical protein